MKIKRNLIKKTAIPFALMGVLSLSACGATIDQEIIIHNEKNVEAEVNVSYPSDYASSETINQLIQSVFDEAPQETKDNTKIKEYHNKERTGIIYSIKNMDREIYDKSFGMNVIKEDGNYRALFQNNSSSSYESYTYKIKMPGKVISSTAGTINGKTVTWNPKLESGELEIVSKSNTLSPFSIGLTSGILLLGAGGCYYFIKQRKIIKAYNK